MSTSRTATDTLFSQLDRDWDALCRRPATAAALVEACAAAVVTSPAALPAAVRQATPEAADAVLVVLARQSHDGSEIAARALLQLLLPGTCRLAAKWWALGSAEERAAAAVAAVYDRLRRYPIERRPAKIAANVLLDANQDLARLARRATTEQQRSTPLEPDKLLASRDLAEQSPAEELRDLVHDAVSAGRVSPAGGDLVVATRIAGHNLGSIAQRTGTPLRTLQWRRRAAEAALIAGAAA